MKERMIELSGEFLRKEIVRLGGIIAQTVILHPLGRKLHSESDPLTAAHAKLMYDTMMESVCLLEPGEDEKSVERSLLTERIAPGNLAPGDVLSREIRDAQGGILAPLGESLESGLIEQIRLLAPEAVEIRKRYKPFEREQVEEYLVKTAALRDEGARFDPQLTRVLRLSPIPIRPLLVPRGRILMALQAPGDRQTIASMLKTGGHETCEIRSFDEFDATLAGSPIDVVVATVNDLAALGLGQRTALKLHRLEVLALVDEENESQRLRALELGANEILTKLPKRDLLLERVRGCLSLLGRRVSLAPMVSTERRKHVRSPARYGCKLSDPTLSTPMAIRTGEVLDSGDGGVLIEYNCPAWPSPWAYTPHGVHPKHFWYQYTKSNPLGRSLRVLLPSTLGTSAEAAAWVVNVEPNGEFERVRMAFEKSPATVRRTATALRPPST